MNNSGDTDMWMRMQYALGPADPNACTWTDWQGKWAGDASDAPGPGYIPGETDTYSFTVTLTEPTPNLYYHIRTEVDPEINDLMPFTFQWYPHRSTGGRSTQSIPMNVSVLDTKMADFYNDTVPIPGTNHAVPKALLKSQLQQAVREYRYKDAAEIARQITALTEGTAEISAEEFLGLKNLAEPYDASYDSVQATSVAEFQDLITRFFSKGFRAKYPLPYPWITIGQYPDFRRQAITPLEQHLLAAGIGNLKILVPKTWFTQTEIELADAIGFAQLPLQTNIKLDPAQAKFIINPSDAYTDTYVSLTTDGPDNPIVRVELAIPSGFTLVYPYNQPVFTQPLKSYIPLRIAPTGTNVLGGSFNIRLKVYLGAEGTQLMFSGSIPFRYAQVSDLIITTTLPPGPQAPLTPGNTFTAISLANHGSVPELLEFEVTGLPDAFIDHSAYPPGSTGNVQSFTLLPDEARPVLIVTPPKIPTTVPGTYPYTVILRDAGTGAIRYESEGELFVGPYHEAELQGTNLVQFGLDSDTFSYTFALTNLGNTLETFVMSNPGLTLAVGLYTPSILTLGPGEGATVSFLAQARGIGFQEFSFKATTAYQTVTVPASIDIQDDDPDAPIIHNVTVTGLDGSAPPTDGMEWLLVTVNATNGYSGVASVGVYAPSLPYRDPNYITAPVGGDLYQVQVLGPRIIGNYTWSITVTDCDADWEGDAATISVPFNVSVIDDDTDAPVIQGVEFLDAMSGTNSTVPDGSTKIRVRLQVTDYSGLSDLSAIVLGSDYTGLGVNPEPIGEDYYMVEIPSPQALGSYVLQVWAADADLDNYWYGYYDQNGTVSNISFSIEDDDRTYPMITGVDFLDQNLDTDPYIWMRLFLSDQESGIGLASVDFYGSTYYAIPWALPAEYLVLLPNPHVSGQYTAHVTAWDADNDRVGDALSNSTSVVVTILNTAPKWHLFYSDAAGAGGEYLATYTFSPQEPAFPTGWILYPAGQPAGAYTVLPSHEGHATVLQLNKLAGIQGALAYQLLQAEIPTGTIEFWGQHEGANSFGLLMGGGAEGPRALLGFNDTSVIFVDATNVPSFIATLSPGWHHYRVDFVADGYEAPAMGLAANHVRITIDGVPVDTFDYGGPLHVTGFGLGIMGIGDDPNAVASGSLYLDAIGVPWDPSYVPGMNLVPRADLTPVDYTGEHRATYTFMPSEMLSFSWFAMSAGQPVPLQPWQVLPAYLDHQTILSLPASSGPDPFGVICPLPDLQSSGTMEMWLAIEGDEGTYAFQAAHAGEDWVILAAIMGGQLTILDGPDNFVPLAPFSAGEWHHLRIDFAGPGQSYLGLGSNKYQLWLDGLNLGPKDLAIDGGIDILAFGIQNVVSVASGHLYVDAIGFSWDPTYAIGQNLVVSGPPPTPVLSIAAGEPGATLTWVPVDVSYESTQYSILVDGESHPSGEWVSGSGISLDVSTLGPGEHLVTAVFDDGISGVSTSSVIVRVGSPQDQFLAAIDAIITAIQSSSNADWRCPASGRKNAMIDKLEEIKALVATGNYAEAYNKLLHDVKPKLTGLKTDEDEVAWGNGVAHKPWVTNTALQQTFKDLINPVLRGVKTLVDGTPSPPCHGHHGGHHHGGPQHGHGNHCSSHHGGPQHGSGHNCGTHHGNGHHYGSSSHPTGHVGCSH